MSEVCLHSLLNLSLSHYQTLSFPVWWNVGQVNVCKSAAFSSMELLKLVLQHCIKVFRYSFFGTIPNLLNRLLDSPFLVRSKWNLQYLLVFDWALAWFTFCENRYFHDNDKQKTSKTLQLKFSAIQISLWKANTNILNCGVWHTKYTRTKKFCMLFWSKTQKHFQP